VGETRRGYYNMKNKKWVTKVGDKIVYHGEKGVRIGLPDSPRQKSYCARSLGIAEKFPSARKKDSPNYQSRRKWRCPLADIER
jgi:hypothetical protein